MHPNSFCVRALDAGQSSAKNEPRNPKWLSACSRGMEATGSCRRLPMTSAISRTGMAVFRVAFDRWVDAANESDWRALIRESLEELKVPVG